ncbi:unnamed protein product [Psylliodes chrysocephalus]|uniref:Uncharacterized protein n=1 Tax=Psylliodes chrysocephalus TaxID=3402493 RepID=A0A9P0D008_9CUCU|nr:unnamed protein product [Psylliodes chrysocephala]
MNVVQEFTANMYGIKHGVSVNEARYQIFIRTNSAKEDNDTFLKRVKSFDSNIIPPCWSSLMQKILRTIYVNSMWLQATDQLCLKLRPENCGWTLENNYLKPIGFIGDQMPLKIDDIAQMTDNENDDESENQPVTSDESDGEC